MKREKVFDAIDGEREFQDEQCARPDRPSMRSDLSMGDYLLAMEENLNRAKRAWYSGHQPYTDTMAYVRKVCALGVSAGEKFGMPERRG